MDIPCGKRASKEAFPWTFRVALGGKIFKFQGVDIGNSYKILVTIGSWLSIMFENFRGYEKEWTILKLF